MPTTGSKPETRIGQMRPGRAVLTGEQRKRSRLRRNVLGSRASWRTQPCQH